MIHPSAQVAAGARLGAGVSIGPHCIVEDGAELGEGVVLEPFVRVHGCVRVGARTRVGTASVLGGEPQDLKYRGESTQVEIGSDVRIYEHVTVHRAAGEGATRVGNHVLLMAGSHVGHNSRVGERAILTNGALLAGHVEVGEGAILSGGTAVHQHCRVGRLSMLGGGCAINKDAVPFSIFSGALPASWRGPNTIGLRRAGFDARERLVLRRVLISMLGRPGWVREVAREHQEHPLASVRELAAFVLSSKRGVLLRRRSARDEADDESGGI